MRTAAAWVLGVGTLWACSLFQSYEGYQGGTAPGGADAAGDGARPLGDASAIVDATTDSIAHTDGGGSGDADAGPLGFCASNPGLTFCADFDEADAGALGGWVLTTPDAGTGSVVVSAGSNRSAPNALAIALGPTNGVDQSVGVSRLLGTYSSKVKLRYALYLDETQNTTSPLAVIHFQGSTCRYEIVFTTPSTATDVARIYEYATAPVFFSATDAGVAVPRKIWTQVDLEANLAASTATLQLNGNVVAQKQITPKCAPYGATAFSFVFNFEGANAGVWKERIDDVAVSAQ